ncbi:hypothetical protein KSF_072810 [Reticulibacter mediterranei]|uniref:Uncharacterized protein n=1 Tax=Reticulibacter mediterranei TaxID=2778369 RepID=A0A8J3INC7_9CHLR|nr:hypothetical protein KSF_072810 [Reticulibacter mediterranei]
MGNNVGQDFAASFASSGQDECVALHRQIHRWIAQSKELMARLDAGKPWFLLPFGHPTEEDLHRLV